MGNASTPIWIHTKIRYGLIVSRRLRAIIHTMITLMLLMTIKIKYFLARQAGFYGMLWEKNPAALGRQVMLDLSISRPDLIEAWFTGANPMNPYNPESDEVLFDMKIPRRSKRHLPDDQHGENVLLFLILTSLPCLLVMSIMFMCVLPLYNYRN